MLSEQAAASFFFCSMFPLCLDLSTLCYLSSLLTLKKTARNVKIDTSFMMHLPQGIYDILCFAKVYIIQSISHLVFHFLKKEKEKKKTQNKICNAEYTSITGNNPWEKILFKLDNTSTCLPMLAIWGLASLTTLSAST